MSSSSSKRRDNGEAKVPSTESSRVDEEVEASFSACRQFRLLELLDEEFGMDSAVEGSSSAHAEDADAIFSKTFDNRLDVKSERRSSVGTASRPERLFRTVCLRIVLRQVDATIVHGSAQLLPSKSPAIKVWMSPLKKLVTSVFGYEKKDIII